MLGKLIKNEFKANSHSIGMIYIVAAVAGVDGGGDVAAGAEV